MDWRIGSRADATFIEQRFAKRLEFRDLLT